MKRFQLTYTFLLCFSLYLGAWQVPSGMCAPQVVVEEQSKMYGKALEYYEFAIYDDAEAQYQLARCYHSGYGVEPNDSLAFMWGKKSALGNYPAGVYFLAYCYETGRGCSVNMANADHLYRKAYEMALPLAKDGNAAAQFVVGKIFDYGNGGVKQDQSTAVKWYMLAADQGYTGAQYNLANCFQLGEGIAENKRKAFFWYREAANQGDADSQYMLGLCYASGEGVTKDNTKAIEWFKKSSRQGHPLAQHILMRVGETW